MFLDLAFFPEFWKTVSSQNIGAQMNFVNCYYDNHLQIKKENGVEYVFEGHFYVCVGKDSFDNCI